MAAVSEGTLLLSHALRRAIAACASILLVLGFIGLTSSSSSADEALWTVRGNLSPPSSTGLLSSVTVRFYKATGNSDEPWLLAETAHSSVESATRGDYTAHLPAGTYRATINEFDDGSAAWGAWKPQVWDKPQDPVDQFTVSGANLYLGQTKLEFRGGTITTKLIDQCGSTPVYTSFRIYDATLASPQASYSEAPREESGGYQLHVLSKPTKIVVEASGMYQLSYPATWYGDAPSFETAKAITLDPSDVTASHDIVLRRPLDLSPGGVQTLSGVVQAPDHTGIVGVPVRFYRATNDPEDPWSLESTTTTQPVDSNNPSGRPSGRFDARLPAGEYRVTVNEATNGEPSSRAWQARLLPNTATTNASVICLERNSGRNASTTLDYAGGPITGRLTSPRGLPIKGASVEAYDASGEAGAPVPAPSTVAVTDVNGEYTAHALSGATKLRFVKEGYTLPAWFGGTSFDTATRLTVPVDGSSTGNDAVLFDAPLRSTTAPRLRVTALYGNKVSAYEGKWAPGYAVTRSYRWARKSGTKLTWVSSSSSSSMYTVRSGDVGKRLVVRETVTPVGNFPGVPAGVRYSTASNIVKRVSKLSLTSKRSGGRLKITVRVSVKGVSHPKGTVKLRARKTSGGGSKSKTVTFKDGKATWTFKASAGGWAYAGTYIGSSTVAPAYDDGYRFAPR